MGIKANILATIPLFFIGISNCIAAEIYKGISPDQSLQYIVISGEITIEDTVSFINTSDGVDKGVVILASPGGSILAAVEIGRRLSQKGYTTFVPEQTLCASSCSLIWLAGHQRYAEESSLIGFHAAYVNDGISKKEIGAGNALVGAYLNGLGLSDGAIIFVTNAPPEGMEWLTKEKGDRNGIEYISISNNLSVEKDKIDYGIKDAQYSPVETVEKFYQALSNADGNLAASYVVPEKRGIGPFNEKNIYDFYSKMQIPLKIVSIEQINKDEVLVKYQYTYTKTQCNGLAKVKTKYYMGHTLLEKITANC